MTDQEIKELWESTSLLFYQDNSEEGVKRIEEVIKAALLFEELGATIEALLTAVENRDYILAGDILHFDMAERL